MAAITFLDAPIDVTPADDANFHDIDVSAYVSNASGVLLRMSHTSSGDLRCFARRKGSTDDYYHRVVGDGHIYHAVGIDADDVFQCRLASTGSDWHIEVLGYFDSADCEFFDNAVQGPEDNGQWYPWDISGLTGANTALAAIFFCVNRSSSPREAGFRDNGSTDNRIHDVYLDTLSGAIIVGVDGNEVLEFHKESSFVELYLTGYIKSGVTMNVNAVDVSIANEDIWQDMSPLPSGILGAFVETASTSSRSEWGIRPDGDADFSNQRANMNGNHGWGVVGTINDVAEAWRESSNTGFYLLGTVDGGALPAAPGNPVILGTNF